MSAPTTKEKLAIWYKRCSIRCQLSKIKTETVAYYCDDIECPNNKTYPIYCVTCQSEL